MTIFKKIIIIGFYLSLISCGKDNSAELISPYFLDNNCHIDNPSQFYGFSEDCYIPLFTDDFSNNDKNWNLKRKNAFTHKIEGGYLKLSTHKDETTVWGTSQDVIRLMNSKNYEYRVTFRIARTENDRENRFTPLIWGSDENLTSYHAIGFNSLGKFELYTATPNARISHFSRQLNSSTFSSYNTFTIRKFNQVIYLFLGSQLLYQGIANELDGDKIFFGAAVGNEVWVDGVGIYQID